MPVRTHAFFLVFLVPILWGAAKPVDHPFHVGVIEIQQNASTQSLEISVKLFTDDFEKGLSNRFKMPIDLINPSRHASMDSLVKRYIWENFSLTVGEKRFVGRYLGYEQEKEAVYAYVEYPEIASLNGLEADCSILYETFSDQINIIHAIQRGERKSSKLSNPAHRVEFHF